MDNNTTGSSPRSEPKNSRLQLRPQRQPSKMRTMGQKVVVRVKIEENDSGGKKHKREGPRSDCWSWRKYGQKPIKGSPYPRGYYRCSSSKGCSAKKQVERSRTDSSVLIITYTSTHNHPGPDLPPTKYVEEEPGEEWPATPVPEQESIQEQKTTLNSKASGIDDEDSFHYSQSPFNSAQDNMIVINQEENPFTGPFATTTTYNKSPSLVVDDEEPLCYHHLVNFSTPKSEENDFYDELEELPQTSSVARLLTRNNFFEERILVNPS